jgi:hypothetical protein
MRKVSPFENLSSDNEPVSLAERIESDVTVLSEPDFAALFSALTEPDEPNEALKSGFRWYRKLTA